MLNKQNKEGEVYTWNTTEGGESLELVGKIKMEGHPVLENVYNNWVAQTEYHPVLRGNEIKEYYEVIRPQVAFPDYQSDEVHYGYFFMFEEGGVYAWKETPLKEDELTIYRRFTSVLSLTYKRYKDLKDAEAREKEAIKQAALDRVRADIASMRSTTDLDRITPLIWKELTTLGISFIRCGVFIMNEKENKVHTYLSTPDGQAIAAFHTTMDNSGSLVGAIEHWRQQKVFVTHWVDADFQTQADILLKQGSITSREQYLNTLPKEGFHLHFLPFRQGMLYVGSNEQLQADALQLVQSLADAFSVAYARYEDFTKLESAKEQIEKTLTDLKQTQTQLIQSEKMASLGELTAGIAHEIQNPLNFVNNFSEVSKELLDEMRVAIEKGDTEDAKEIMNDVIQNLEKINHHGKRADGIVKGMLQHSRSSSGVKEPTDINALCDEYLRLSYHGLRAKDKSFNAKFETYFDSTLPKINVVPQDIGRVVLNLLTNAFYVVDGKKKSGVEGYEPTVSVSTKNLGSKIEISVKDNGSGIPDSIKEKIFQPFFTTKPTGQGTGLGLSLSYDIVKAHGGELRVETKEGEGSEFIITLIV
ncbi:MAG: ATP-binding protein [Cytophagales bacterium]|nr:ATP-binding protein [Cytophagales bacterium]